jgi:hypothetical protein
MVFESAVASIVQVGAEASVGDIVVAAAVVTPDIDKKVRIRSKTALDTFNVTMSIALNDSEETLIEIETRPDNGGNMFIFDATSRSFSPPELLGNRFRDFATLADFSTVVGFCPKTAADLKERLFEANENLSRIIRAKYPKARLCNSDIPSFLSKSHNRTWSDGNPKFPKKSLVLTREALSGSTDTAKIQSIVSSVVAEALAAGVRTARIFDLSEIYPALKLDTNFGYSCRQLYHGLQKFPYLMGKGLRGELTEHWIQWAETNLAPRHTMKEETKNAPNGKRKVRSKNQRLAPGEISTDKDGREIMGFDKAKAIKMSDELYAELEKDTAVARKWSRFTTDFVGSIHSQLSNGRRLTGRQMYVLSQVHEKKGW